MTIKEVGNAARLTSAADRHAPTKAFTLTEMLVVIAVIGILAGILLGALPGVLEKRDRKRVEVELTQLVSAIEYYKEKQGFYPPDNSNNIALPPLFYELVGTKISGSTPPVYVPKNDAPGVPAGLLSFTFGTPSILNASAEASEVQNFYKTLRPRQYKAWPGNTNIMVLTVPGKGPQGTNFNPWRYIVAKPNAKANDPYPTNNPTSFDLWGEIEIRGRRVAIGNWKE